MKRRATRYKGVYAHDTLKGVVYEVDYKGSDGKRRFKTLPVGTTAREANEERSRIIARMSRGERIAPTRRTVEDLWKEWIPLQNQLRPGTIERYETGMRRVLPLIGQRKVADLTVSHVASMVSELVGKGYKAWTIRGDLTALSRLMQYAIREGMRSTNPVKDLDKNERPKSDARPLRILDRNEIGLLLNAASPSYKPILTVALFTGLRRGEILALEWSDVDFEKGKIHVRASKTATGVRSVVAVAAVVRTLSALSLSHHTRQSETGVAARLVFSTGLGNALGARNVLRSHYTAVERAGIESVRFHDLRHTFASILIDQGHDVAFVSAQMGHSKISTTWDIYGHLWDAEAKEERMREAFDREFGQILT